MIKPVIALLHLLILNACAETKNEPLPAPAAIISDSISSKMGALKAADVDASMGIGLTQEEMADDTVFADGSTPGSWQTAGVIDVKGFKLYLKNVQQMVLNDEKEKLAKCIAYPLGERIRSEKDFIRNYERIFSKDAKLAIARINFSQLFRNSQGVMIDNGRIWFSQVGDHFKIIAINR